MNHGLVWNTYELHLRSSWKRHQRRLEDWRMLSYFPNSVTQCSLRRVTRKFWFPFIPGERSTAKDTLHWFVWILCSVGRFLACENIRFSSPFTAGDVSRETSPAEKSKMEKRMFSQARRFYPTSFPGSFPTRPSEGSNWRGHPDLCFTHQALDHFELPRVSVSKRGWVLSLWYANEFSFSCK